MKKNTPTTAKDTVEYILTNNLLKPVVIFWNDPMTTMKPKPTEVENLNSIVMVTIGHLVNTDKDCIRVSYMRSGKPNFARYVQVIPKTSVIRAFTLDMGSADDLQIKVDD